jgi:glutamine transport system substrate-binding protein
MNTFTRVIAKSVIIVIGGLLLALSTQAGGLADNGESNRSLLAGISPFKPFVILSGDTVEGFSIDLWQEMAKELKLDYVFVRSVGISGTLSDVEEKRVDVAIGCAAMPLP